ncbi:MAG TPA: MarR family transcriptional regulator [Streptosporangiaceae bacterium]|jgi:MarR family transcriptional regulator, organic hydroperoxide resistance regulator|nr:MarR family transcriptional regulator [Streptosporangiaceae bacterium]
MDEQQGTALALDPGLVRHGGLALDAEPVPHAEPLFVTETGDPVSDDELNQQIANAFTELIKEAHELGQGIASDFGLTGSDAKALFLLGTPLTMKELGQRMGCDPSFVTTVADALERHGLARREPSQRDRRSKNLVLTPEGVRLRGLICGEISARAPWCTTLDTSERRCLLGLIRKMLKMGGGR